MSLSASAFVYDSLSLDYSASLPFVDAAWDSDIDKSCCIERERISDGDGDEEERDARNRERYSLGSTQLTNMV